MKRVAMIACGLMVAGGAVFVWIQGGPAFRHPFVALALVRATAPSELPVPVTGVRPQQLTDSWGSPRSGGRTHQGIDIFAPRGRAIVSTTRGIVVTVGHNSLGGRVVR